MLVVPVFGGGKASMFLEVPDQIVHIVITNSVGDVRNSSIAFPQQLFRLFNSARRYELLIGDADRPLEHAGKMIPGQACLIRSGY